MLRSDLCDYSNVYILLKGDTIVTDANNAKINKSVAFKNNARFINCISKINGVKTDNAEDLDVVLSMYNLIEYSRKYRKITGTLWNYYRDEPSDPLCSNSESLKYKTSITGNTYNIGAGEAGYNEDKVGKNETEIAIPLKHLGNFWRALNIPLINCEIEVILTWPKNCVLTDITANAANNSAIVAPTGLEIELKETKLYVPVVTLSKENDTKLLEQLKLGFKRTVKWNKYRSLMTIQSNNNNLDYLIDLTFANVNRLFVLSFARIGREDNTIKNCWRR